MLGKFKDIGYQVDDDLLQPGPVGFDRGHPGGQFREERHITALKLSFELSKPLLRPAAYVGTVNEGRLGGIVDFDDMDFLGFYSILSP
jgi:hypothetical protein